MRSWIVALAACGGGGDRVDTPPAGSAAPVVVDAPPPDPFGKLVVTRDGKRIPMARAFAKRVAPDLWRVLVGDREGSCAELLAGVTDRVDGATSFVVTIARRIAPDGKPSSVITDFWSAGHLTQPTFGAATLDGEPDKGKQVTVELARIVDVDGASRLEVAGTFPAEGCGQPPPDDRLAPAVSTATIELAGVKLPLTGATLTDGNLTLSTAPRDCTSAAPAQLVLARAKSGWQLGGTWIGSPTSTATPDLQAATGKHGKSTTELALSGTATLAGYKVTLAGTIAAIDCPSQKTP